MIKSHTESQIAEPKLEYYIRETILYYSARYHNRQKV